MTKSAAVLNGMSAENKAAAFHIFKSVMECDGEIDPSEVNLLHNIAKILTL